VHFPGWKTILDRLSRHSVHTLLADSSDAVARSPSPAPRAPKNIVPQTRAVSVDTNGPMPVQNSPFSGSMRAENIYIILCGIYGTVAIAIVWPHNDGGAWLSSSGKPILTQFRHVPNIDVCHSRAWDLSSLSFHSFFYNTSDDQQDLTLHIINTSTTLHLPLPTSFTSFPSTQQCIALPTGKLGAFFQHVWRLCCFIDSYVEHQTPFSLWFILISASTTHYAW
jgi:hypothetical protein